MFNKDGTNIVCVCVCKRIRLMIDSDGHEYSVVSCFEIFLELAYSKVFVQCKAELRTVQLYNTVQ